MHNDRYTKYSKWKSKKGKHYNNYTLLDIMKHYRYNPYYTLDMLEEYLSVYYTDFIAYTNYINLLLDFGDCDSAKQVIDFVDDFFPSLDYTNFIRGKMRYYILTGQYDLANDLYIEYKDAIIERDPQDEVFEVVYGRLKNLDKYSTRSACNKYLYNQIIDYSYEDFLLHIQKHLADVNVQKEVPNPVIFAPSFPVYDILDRIRSTMPNDNRINFGFHNNFYTFRYEANGRIAYKSVDYFRVITINGTNNIITMYPLEHGEGLPYIDLSYLKEELEPSAKVRKISRVDKFYDKYGDNV